MNMAEHIVLGTSTGLAAAGNGAPLLLNLGVVVLGILLGLVAARLLAKTPPANGQPAELKGRVDKLVDDLRRLEADRTVADAHAQKTTLESQAAITLLRAEIKADSIVLRAETKAESLAVQNRINDLLTSFSELKGRVGESLKRS